MESHHFFHKWFPLSVGAIGKCITDTFSVTVPGGFGSPVICGTNTGYHSKFPNHLFVTFIHYICLSDPKWFWMPQQSVTKLSLTSGEMQPLPEVGTSESPTMHVGMKQCQASYQSCPLIASVYHLYNQDLLDVCNTTRLQATQFKSRLLHNKNELSNSSAFFF